ncbi:MULTISPECIES: hypothetical protein [unclassified Veillonella]|uniref:hypothetical protein n=1 Tax=unclassified Veillonella TaxID=2630086 RepID=UPI000F8F7B58|nr:MULTISPECIES: hypothetical protein [unclassified Veillonella]
MNDEMQEKKENDLEDITIENELFVFEDIIDDILEDIIDICLEEGGQERIKHCKNVISEYIIDFAKIDTLRGHEWLSTFFEIADSKVDSDHNFSTDWDIGHIVHGAGVESAEFVAIFCGIIVVVQQIIALLKNEVDGKEALLNIGGNTFKQAVKKYILVASSTLLKNTLEEAHHVGLRGASMTGLPETAVQVSIATSKILYQYCAGKIDAKTCVQKISVQGANMLSANLLSVIGQIVIPIPIAGAIIGNIAGYTMSAFMVKTLQETFDEECISIERRKELEKASVEYIQQKKIEREQFERDIDRYLANKKKQFEYAFIDMQDAIKLNDTQWVIDMGNRMLVDFDGEIVFKNQSEFDILMEQEDALRI